MPVLAQDALLGLFVAVMQVQGSVAKPQDVGARPLTDFGYLGYVLLIVSGLVLAVRRRWPVPVFITAALASLVYYAIGFSDGPGWIGLFVALYTLTAYGDGRRSLAIAGVGITVLATGWLIAAADIEPRAAIGWVFFRIAASVMAAALGESVRSRRSRPKRWSAHGRRNGPGRRRRVRGSTPSGSGSRARSTTPSRTPSRSSTCRPVSPRTCSTSGRNGRARRW